MYNLKVITILLAVTLLGFTATSKEINKETEANGTVHSEISMEGQDHNHIKMAYNQMVSSNAMVIKTQQTSQSKIILANYMTVKDALVGDDGKSAATAAKQLESNLGSFNDSYYSTEQQAKLKDIIGDAKEHARHISKSEIEQQRKHFKPLSKAIMEMVAITGTETTLYQQYCPMYDKGSAWLSKSKDIKNPYYGSKMLACGRVEKEIN